MRLYENSPIVLQNLACSIAGYQIQRRRYSREFYTFLSVAEENDKVNEEEFCKRRYFKLRQIINYSANNIPFYSRIFSQLKLDPREIKTVQDLSLLPIITKDQIIKGANSFKVDRLDSHSLLKEKTSGTTGAGMSFYTTQSAHRQQFAIWWRNYRRWGLTLGTPCSIFTGQTIVPIAQEVPPFWRYNFVANQIRYSIYHGSPLNLTSYLKHMSHKRLNWIHGYPSMLANVASFMLDKGFELPFVPKWITTGAENLMPAQKALITEAFKREPFEHYGQCEAVANISQAPCGRFHVDEDYSAVELVPTDKPNIFRLIGTSLSNFAMPFLRYDTNDLVTYTSEKCNCGLPGRVVDRIDGREEEYVILKNGTKVGRLDFIFKEALDVREAQIHQTKSGNIIVNIVRRLSYTDFSEKELINQFRERLGEYNKLEFNYVNEIPKPSSGKLRFVTREK